MAKLVAITGVYASGKTYIMKIIKNLGYEVFSCDSYINSLYLSGELPKLLEKKIPKLQNFTKSSFKKIFYNDINARKKIESIIHPIVINEIKLLKNSKKNLDFIFIEIPLLFEKSLEYLFIAIICAYCKEESRVNRFFLKGESDISVFNKINKLQMSQQEKISKSDYLINTDLTDLEIINNIKEILDSIKCQKEK